MTAPSLTPVSRAACEEIGADELARRLAATRGDRIYMLDARVMEDWAYPGLADDMLEFPPAPTVEELVRSQDPRATLAWAWTHTEAQSQREAGPLLAASSDARMLDTFVDSWSDADGALLLVSEHPLQSVADHFGTLRSVGMPDGGEAMLRWNPAKLRGILEALPPERRAVLLGASHAVAWRENIGPRHRWWWARNPHRPEPRFDGSTPFAFTADELASIQKAGHHHFVETLAYDRLQSRPGDDMDVTLVYIERSVQKLLQLNINSEAVIRGMNRLFPWRAHPFDDDAVVSVVSNRRESPEDRLDNLRRMEDFERTQQ